MSAYRQDTTVMRACIAFHLDSSEGALVAAALARLTVLRDDKIADASRRYLLNLEKRAWRLHRQGDADPALAFLADARIIGARDAMLKGLVEHYGSADVVAAARQLALSAPDAGRDARRLIRAACRQLQAIGEDKRRTLRESQQPFDRTLQRHGAMIEMARIHCERKTVIRAFNADVFRFDALKRKLAHDIAQFHVGSSRLSTVLDGQRAVTEAEITVIKREYLRDVCSLLLVAGAAKHLTQELAGKPGAVARIGRALPGGGARSATLVSRKAVIFSRQAFTHHA